LSFFACNGEAKKDALGEEEQRELALLKKQLEDEAGIQALVPEYTPPKVSRVPVGYSRETPVGFEVILSYDSSQDMSSGSATPSQPFVTSLLLFEQSKKGSCGPNLLVDSSVLADNDITVDGHLIQEKILRISNDTVTQDLRFSSDGLCIIVNLEWFFASGTPDELSDDMRSEGIRVVSSMMGGS
jgi:hypothetical protein